MFSIFKQRKTVLFNGKQVRENDMVSFIDSDGNKHFDRIRRRMFDNIHNETGELLKKGTLFFWNSCYRPNDYKNADITTTQKQ